MSPAPLVFACTSHSLRLDPPLAWPQSLASSTTTISPHRQPPSWLVLPDLFPRNGCGQRRRNSSSPPLRAPPPPPARPPGAAGGLVESFEKAWWRPRTPLSSLLPQPSAVRRPPYRSGAGVVDAPTQGVAPALDDRERDVELEGQIGEEEGWPLGSVVVRSDVEAGMTPILSCSRANRVCCSSFVILCLERSCCGSLRLLCCLQPCDLAGCSPCYQGF